MITWSGQKPVFPPPVKPQGAGGLVSDNVIEYHLGGGRGRDGSPPAEQSIQQ